MAKQFRRSDRVEWHTFQSPSQSKVEQKQTEMIDSTENRSVASSDTFESFLKSSINAKQVDQKSESRRESYRDSWSNEVHQR